LAKLSQAAGCQLPRQTAYGKQKSCGNDYRLITAIHYNTGMVYVMLFLTHAEYDKQAWKERL